MGLLSRVQKRLQVKGISSDKTSPVSGSLPDDISSTSVTDAITAEDLKACRDLFDADYYTAMAKAAGYDIAPSPEEAFLHYIVIGWRHGLSPCEDFDDDFYCGAYSDVAGADSNPLLHYVRYGRNEGRIPRGPTTAELALVAEIVDPNYYLARYNDLAKSNTDPVQHFATFGWREGRDPNPFTLLRFVRRATPNLGQTLTEVATHLSGAIFHNPLMRKPTTLHDLRAALGKGDTEIADYFNFDVVAYSAAQPDVLANSPYHPIEHLFYDGLLQNRLRGGGFLHRALVPFDSYVNDYELLIAQDGPLVATTFSELDLSSPKAETEADLSGIFLCVGVVLYQNSQSEIGRLIRSIASNAKDTNCSVKLIIWDNSPTSLDLREARKLASDLSLEVSLHPENQGFSLGHNGLMQKAFAMGASHYLGLNPDGYLWPEALTHLLRFAATKDHPAIIELDCEPLTHPKWYHPVTGETDWISGAAFMLNAAAFEKTNGFDPEFPMYCEDTDLSFRALMSGVSLYVSPRGRYYHDITNRLHGEEEWRKARMMEGTWYLCQKWGNVTRAKMVQTEMARHGFDVDRLPEAPEIMADIPEKISDLIQKERFANSRFWGG